MQAQVLAELERERAARRASYARRKKRTLNGTSAQAQAKRDRERPGEQVIFDGKKESWTMNNTVSKSYKHEK